MADDDNDLPLPARLRALPGLAAIQAAPAPLTAEEVLKAVSGYATGALQMPASRLAAFYKLGEAYRLWGARAVGVQERKPAPAKGLDVRPVDTD